MIPWGIAAYDNAIGLIFELFIAFGPVPVELPMLSSEMPSVEPERI